MRFDLLVPVAVYVMAGKRTFIFILAGLTLVSWWFLCDYYLLEVFGWWSPGWEHAGFLSIPAAYILALVALECCAFWKTVRHFPDIRLVQPQQAFPPSVWNEMMCTLAAHPDTCSRSLFRWYGRMLGRLPADQNFSVRKIRHVWWLEPRLAWRTGLALTWLPLLCAVLILGPLLTPMMEQLASSLSRDGQTIYAVDFVGRNPSTNKLIRERLQAIPGGFRRTGTSSHIAAGRFELTSTRFPRVYRIARASCDALCQLIDPPKELPQLELTDHVIAGAASFEWVQTSPEQRLGLVVVLRRAADGRCLDRKVIEP